MTSRHPRSTSADRQREAKRERQRRYRANIAARRICATIAINENGLQALVCAGLLPDELAHLKDEIRRSAQDASNQFAADQLKKAGLL